MSKKPLLPKCAVCEMGIQEEDFFLPVQSNYYKDRQVHLNCLADRGKLAIGDEFRKIAAWRESQK